MRGARHDTQLALLPVSVSNYLVRRGEPELQEEPAGYPYHALPYPVQARADMFSPRFFEEVKRLKSRGLSNREIGGKLGVSAKTVASVSRKWGSENHE